MHVSKMRVEVEGRKIFTMVHLQRREEVLTELKIDWVKLTSGELVIAIPTLQHSRNLLLFRVPFRRLGTELGKAMLSPLPSTPHLSGLSGIVA